MSLSNFAYFGGLDQRTSPVLRPPNSSSDCKNVALHPVGVCKSRNGFTVWESPLVTGEDAPTQIDGLAIVSKIADARQVLIAMAPDRIYRTLLSTVSWEEALEYGSSVANLAHITTIARFVDDSNSASPTDRGECIYIADGTRIPMVERGLATASGSLTELPEGEYGTDTDWSGEHGYPHSGMTNKFGEWREWDNYPPAGLFLRGEGQQDRMYAWGFGDDPNRIDVSELGIPWNFLRTYVDAATPSDSAADGGYFYAIEDDGDFVVGVTDLYNLLVIFKHKRTILYTGLYSGNSVGLDLQQVLPVGCASYRSVVRVGRDLYFWSPEAGPVSLQGIQEYGDIGLGNPGELVSDAIDALNKDQLDKIVAYHDEENRRVVWFAPQAGETTNNIAFCYYYDQPRWTLWDGGYAEMAYTLVGPGSGTPGLTVYGGDYNGNIASLNIGNDDNTVDIDSYYITEWFDLGDPDIRKRIQYLDILVGTAGAQNMGIYIGWDYADTWFEITDLVKMFGSPSAYFGHAIWGTSLWGGTAQALKRYSLEGTGYLFRLKFASEDGGQFEVAGWKPSYAERGGR